MGNVDYIYESMKLTSSLCTIIAAEILGLCDSYSLQRREFYFDRSPRIFENILGLYRKGELHLTERVCPRDFLGKSISITAAQCVELLLSNVSIWMGDRQRKHCAQLPGEEIGGTLVRDFALSSWGL